MVHVVHYPIVYSLVIVLWSMTMTCAKVMATQDPAVLRYEEYVVEHEISATQAKNVALKIDVDKITIPPGCQSCTRNEINYCLSSDLMNDHCCCDRRHHEYLDFIPHTCYVGTVLCHTIARDCTEYESLRTCCCIKLLLQKWKEKSSAYSSCIRPERIYFLLMLLYIVNIYL